MTPYQIFGSANSLDLDLVFLLDELPTSILDRLNLAKELSKNLQPTYPEKVINANLAVCKDGVLVDVYKGTTDELNNAMYETYNLHKQVLENQIKRPLKRDVDLKFLRSTRMLLMYLSKTKYRIVVKPALRGSLETKIETLKLIELTCITDFSKSKIDKDIVKSIAFQIGQSIALHYQNEFYTKNQIAKGYPDLAKYLQREDADLTHLEYYWKVFITILKIRSKTMIRTHEYKYGE